MKKLSNVEMNVISNEISKRVNELKYEKIKGKLEKDSDFKKLEKLSVEIKKLNDSVSEKNKLYNEICLKVRNKYNISSVMRYGNFGGVDIKFNDSNYNNIYNDLVLYSIGKDLDVESLINKIVEKYS